MQPHKTEGRKSNGYNGPFKRQGLSRPPEGGCDGGCVLPNERHGALEALTSPMWEWTRKRRPMTKLHDVFEQYHQQEDTTKINQRYLTWAWRQWLQLEETLTH